MGERLLFELVNPSDPITFRATVEEAAVMAAIFSASLLFVRDPDGNEPKVEDVAAEREAIWANADRIASYAEAWRSLLVGSRADRLLFEKATERMTPDEARAFRAEYHDQRRTSMNDICAQCWEAAERIAASKPTGAAA